jgi:hypothetical protein
MDRDSDIEDGIKLPRPRSRRGSRAPWDPPPRQAKPRKPDRSAAARCGRLADAFGLKGDDADRGSD